MRYRFRPSFLRDMRSNEIIRLSECAMSDEQAALEAFKCRSWDVWNQGFEFHYGRIKRNARKAAEEMIWC